MVKKFKTEVKKINHSDKRLMSLLVSVLADVLRHLQ
jgi:hypothetical protein